MPPRVSPPRLTHFLCLPLVTPTSRNQLQASLHAFGIDVVKETAENPAGIPEKSIRPVGTLHLTLGVMSLLTPERINKALATLKSLDLKDLLRTNSSSIEKASEKGNDRDQGSDLRGKASRPLDHAETLKVTLRGLASMHAPSKTSVLFAKPVDEDLHLQSFCVKLKEVFAAADLLVPDKRPLLLHATIINTVYVTEHRGKGKDKLTIDAREILEDYKGFEWMKDVTVEKVAICRMGAQTKDDGDGEYVIEGEIAMPR